MKAVDHEAARFQQAETREEIVDCLRALEKAADDLRICASMYHGLITDVKEDEEERQITTEYAKEGAPWSW